MTDRKKPGVALWATVVVVVLALYVLSYGPACWWGPRPNSLPAWARPVYWYFLPADRLGMGARSEAG
jgi:hypothetical protein